MNTRMHADAIPDADPLTPCEPRGDRKADHVRISADAAAGKIPSGARLLVSKRRGPMIAAVWPRNQTQDNRLMVLRARVRRRWGRARKRAGWEISHPILSRETCLC